MTLPVSLLDSIMEKIAPDSMSMVQLKDLPQDLREMWQNGMLAKLRILPQTTMQENQVLLEINDATFALQMKTKLPLPNMSEEYTIPVKLASGDRVQIQNLSGAEPKIASLSEQSSAVKMNVDIGKQLADIKVVPLKLNEVIAPKVQEMPIPQAAKEVILQSLPKLDAEIVALGKDLNIAKNVLQPVYENLQEIAENVQKLPDLLPKLQQQIAELSGQKIGAEVTSRLNETTFLKTDLGNTLFSSPVKLATGENLTLEINSPIYPTDKTQNNVSLVNDFFELLAGKTNITDSKIREFSDQLLQKILSVPSQKTANTSVDTKLNANLNINNEAVMKVAQNILPKVPTFGNNFMANVANFMTAATKGDAEIWLGKDNVQTIITNFDNAPKALQVLNDFVSSAVKETPLWRVVEIPVYAENRFSYVKIALPKERENGEQAKKKGTRFMVETQFSKLGSFQFDGFVQKSSRNLDLVVRTSRELEEDFCTQIINLYKNTLYNLNYVGNIKINQRDEFINIYAGNKPKEGIYI